MINIVTKDALFPDENDDDRVSMGARVFSESEEDDLTVAIGTRCRWRNGSEQTRNVATLRHRGFGIDVMVGPKLRKKIEKLLAGSGLRFSATIKKKLEAILLKEAIAFFADDPSQFSAWLKRTKSDARDEGIDEAKRQIRETLGIT